ncbi:MAG: hypothetical protein U0M02_05730 [Acutalibacteraceae bacterium]|nr:hypothetical protein [Acutalibacteraceae bacterium]
MNKKIILSTLGAAAAIVAIVLLVDVFTMFKDEKKCREYEQLLGGTSYTAFDINKTKHKGKATFDYEMCLDKDGTCEIDCKIKKSDDNSMFPDNGTVEFELTGLTWDVRVEGGKYVVYILGDWDWPQSNSAAEIDRALEIIDIEGEDLFFKAIRSGHYDVHFTRIKQ